MPDNRETKEQYRARVRSMTKEQLDAELAKVKADLVKAGMTAEQVEDLERSIRAGKILKNAAKAFFGTTLPGLMLDAFQLFLIVEKIWGLSPFGHLPWTAILLPFLVPLFVNSVYAAVLVRRNGK